MRAYLKNIIEKALDAARKEGKIGAGAAAIIIEKSKREEFGDFATNIAMLLSSHEGRKPREIAKDLIEKISASEGVKKCEAAGPGFINIFLDISFWHAALLGLLKKGDKYGELKIGAGKKVMVEFVSANPTGPLHIGHGRGAAVGDSLSSILKAAGYDVTREYYINDAGVQVHILGESVRLRCLELKGAKVAFPEDYYKGDYVKEISAAYSTAVSPPSFDVFAQGVMLERIKKDLSDFGVEFNVWTSEKNLHEKGLVKDTLEELKNKGHTYSADGALWFRTTAFGDDKDRVLKKADGELTYLASDAAYHREKIKRGFNFLVNVWGADHHGYEARVRAAIKAFSFDSDALKILFIQLVSLSRGGAPVAMGKREGEFVTLREVIDEVGRDAARFFFLMRKSDAQLDFDLELAKKQAPENPVYYVQYCHARITSIMGFAKESGLEIPDEPPVGTLKRLVLKEEVDIIKHLSAFEEVIEKSALEMEPHRITFYLQELAAMFHPYYNRNRVVTDDKELSLARLFLCKAVAGVVKKGLSLLGVSAPEKM